VVFVLVAGAAFAADLSGSVRGALEVIKSDTSKKTDGKIGSSGAMELLRVDGSGEVADGKFGGYIRLDPGSASLEIDDKVLADPNFDPTTDMGKVLKFSSSNGFSGNAWWKPVEQFKLMIGSNGGDGFIGKEGHTGWMFYQTATDGTVTLGGGNVWGGGYGATIYRNAFFEGNGDGQNAAYLFIKPIDIISINAILPFFSGHKDKDGNGIGGVFQHATFQADVNVDGVGNIAVTYALEGEKDGSIHAYYGGSFGALGLDVGIGYHYAEDMKKKSTPLGIGLGVRYGADAFGVKFRAVASLGGEDKYTAILAEVLPSYKFSDTFTGFLAAGLSLGLPDGGDAETGFHVNPYIIAGEEWGPKFLAGFKLWSNGNKVGTDDPTVNWSVPVTIQVSF